MVGERISIVDSTPGVTRDRVYGVIEKNNIPVIIIDTGGLKFSQDMLSKMIRKQIDFALDEADVNLLLVDGKEGLHPLDEEITGYIRKAGKRKALVINKMDRGEDFGVSAEFSSIVLDKTFLISSIHGYGVDILSDWIIDGFEQGEIVRGRKIGVIGKPNTGKSTLVNAILGYERSIIKKEPGTTRDSINSYLEFNGENIVLIDTAGLKRKARLADSIEYYSFLRAVRTIEDSDIVFILIDSTKKVSRQDKRIIKWSIDRETPLIILLSKFDIIPNHKRKEVMKYFDKILSFVEWVPKIPLSSFTMEGVNYSLLNALKILDWMDSPRTELKEVVQKAYEHRPPPSKINKIKIFSVTQKHNKIMIQTNEPTAFNKEYIRYLRNAIRKELKFEGVPIVLIFKPVYRRDEK